ncbi:hypothetical protein A9Q99_10390 [Gammaproteobacteria bacterium 45_16_T64]|nr:hypothetical protein A9Q99_10390 [Gammaproteobacteria bacterium 45_16_T64]
MSKQQQQFTLISHTLCPYVQRAVIALEELGLEYKRIDIDLGNKPEWFKELSPLGKVPVLVVDDDTVLFESAVIAEYINEITEAEMLSAEPVGRARERAWIEFASATINNIGQLYSAKDETQYREVGRQLNAKWSMLDANLSDAAFFGGDKFSLVDAAFAPAFRYLDVFENFAEFSCLARLPKVSQWRQALKLKPSVIGAVSEDYPALLTQFVAKRDSHLGRLAAAYQQDAAMV